MRAAGGAGEAARLPFGLGGAQRATQNEVLPFGMGGAQRATQNEALPFGMGDVQRATQNEALPFGMGGAQRATQNEALPFGMGQQRSTDVSPSAAAAPGAPAPPPPASAAPADPTTGLPPARPMGHVDPSQLVRPPAPPASAPAPAPPPVQQQPYAAPMPPMAMSQAAPGMTAPRPMTPTAPPAHHPSMQADLADGLPASLPGGSASPGLAPPTSVFSGGALSGFEDEASDAPEEWSIQAAAVNMDEIYASDDLIVEHDVADTAEFTEVEVDFESVDETVHATVDMPEPMAPDEEPGLHPARALAVRPGADTEAQRLADLGFGAFQAGDPLAAEVAFDQLAKARPDLAAAHANRGLALMQLASAEAGADVSPGLDVDRLWEEAVAALQQAARLAPDEIDILYDLGLAMSHAQRTGPGLAVVSAALGQAPDDLALLNLSSSLLLAESRFEEALADLRRAAVLGPHDPIVQANLSRLVPV